MIITRWENAKDIIRKSKIVYLWFGSSHCGDCIMMEPIIKELIKHFSKDKDIVFLKVDAEESQLFRDTNSKYKVLRIPTHVFIINDKIINIMYEYIPLELMINEINKLK